MNQYDLIVTVVSSLVARASAGAPERAFSASANSSTPADLRQEFHGGAQRFWGLPEAMVASAFSTSCLDYDLPLVPSFGIDDPRNWIAWATSS